MNPDDDKLELGGYLEVLTRWWWVMLLIPAVVGGLAYYKAYSVTPTYRAQEEILVQQAKSGLIGPAIAGANEALAGTYANLATTKSLLDQMRQGLDTTEPPIVRASGNGAILRISAEHRDPVVARDAASRLSELLILDIQTSKLVEIARLESMAESQGITVDREILQAQLSTIDSLRVIESATIPGSPIATNLVRNTVFGAVLGLLLGAILAFMLDYFSEKLRSTEQLDRLLGTVGSKSTALGVIYRWSSRRAKPNALVTRDQPDSLYAETFRHLRSGFQFARSADPAGNKSFLITSATPMEGKTTIASNLAVALAQAGSRVILVDGDLRRPFLHEVFGLNNGRNNGSRPGLADLLGNRHAPIPDDLADPGIPGLRVLTSGNVQGNPADLLASPEAKVLFEQLRRECDVLLVDSPPVMASVDPLILAGYVDGIIITVNLATARHDVLRDALSQISKTGTPVLGYVLNKVTTKKLGYGHYYKKYGYSGTTKLVPGTPATNGHGPKAEPALPDDRTAK